MEKWGVLLMLVGTLLLAACHHPRYAHRHYPVHSAIVVDKPPPLKVVVRPTVPSAHHVWIGGRWTWRGHWVWVDGYYIKRPYQRAHWVTGQWKRKRHGWVWIPGHWRRG